MRALILLAGLILLSGCANRPKIDRVVDRPVEILIPLELTNCPPPMALSEAEIAALETETQLVEQWILPQAEAHEMCWRNMQRVRKWGRE